MAQGLVVLQMTSEVIQANPFHWTSELFRALALQSSCYFWDILDIYPLIPHYFSTYSGLGTVPSAENIDMALSSSYTTV